MEVEKTNSDNMMISFEAGHNSDVGEERKVEVPHCCMRVSMILSLIWGIVLMVFLVFFATSDILKSELLNFSKTYQNATFLNLIVMILLETALLMVGVSAAVPELCYVFVLKDYLLAFVVAAIARQLCTLFCYWIGRYIIRSAMYNYMRTFKIYISLVKMLETRPMTTILLVRLSAMPSFIKYYGLPALDPSFSRLNFAVFLTTVFQTHFYLVPGYIAREESEISSGEFKNKISNYALTGCIGAYIIIFFVLGWLISRQMKKLAEEAPQNELIDTSQLSSQRKFLDRSTLDDQTVFYDQVVLDSNDSANRNNKNLALSIQPQEQQVVSPSLNIVQ